MGHKPSYYRKFFERPLCDVKQPLGQHPADRLSSARSGRPPRRTHGASTHPRATAGRFRNATNRELTPAYWTGRSELKLTATISQAPPGGRLNTTSCFPWSVVLSVNTMS